MILNALKNRSLRILLAEDNLMNQKLVTTLLKGLGLEVVVAENGEEVVKLLSKDRFDLVLMDIQMPLLDGYQATEQIRSLLHLSLPVIAMSAHTLAGEIEKCMACGMNDYIAKPFKEQGLYEILLKYLGAEIPKQQRPSLREAIAQPGTKAIYLGDLYEMANGDRQFIQEMIQLFITQSPSDIRELQDAFLGRNYEAIGAVAHRMKTSVGFIGLKNLLAPLSHIEQLARSASGMDVIEKEFHLVKCSSEAAVEELKQVLLDPRMH